MKIEWTEEMISAARDMWKRFEESDIPAQPHPLRGCNGEFLGFVDGDGNRVNRDWSPIDSSLDKMTRKG